MFKGASGEIALVLAVIVFALGVRVWRAVRGPSPANSSPDPSGAPAERAAGGHDPSPGDREGPVDTWLAANRDRQSPAHLQRTAAQVHGVSASTVKRAWRRVRSG